MLSQILEVGGCGSVDGYYPYLGEIAFRLLKPALSPLQLFCIGGFQDEVEPASQDLDARDDGSCDRLRCCLHTGDDRWMTGCACLSNADNNGNVPFAREPECRSRADDSLGGTR